MAYDFVKNFLGKSARLQKYGHDLSNNEVFSMPFGVEGPVKHYFTSPNEFFKLNVSGYVQTAPMREDNFADIKQELRAVYVPMSSIMRDYLSITSAERNTRRDDLVPVGCNFTFSLDSVLGYCFCIYSAYRILQVTSALTQGKTTLWIAADNKWSVEGVDMATLATPDEAIYVSFLVSMSSNLQNGTDFNWLLRSLESFVNPLSHQLFCFDVLRLLDQLEYGNYLPSFSFIFDRVLAGHIELNMEFSQSSDVGYYFSSDAGYYSEYFPKEKLSLFPLFAYQYYVNVARRSNYRNPFGELYTCDAFLSIFDNNFGTETDYGFTLNPGSPSNYNFDCILASNTCASFSFAESASYLVSNLTLNNGLRDLSGYIESLFVYFFSLNNPLLDSDLFTSSQLTVVSGSIPGTTSGTFNSNPVQEMNNLEALYKLRQDLLRAGIRRDKQLESVFGVKGNAHVYEKIQILDVASHSISIDPVISTAETEEGTLGERASRGNGKNNIHCSVTAEDYGFIFITSCFTADMFYEAFSIYRQHYLDPKSWYLPQFAHLGLEPIRRKSLSVYGTARSSGNANVPFDGRGNVAIGFSSHDWHLKTQVNVAHGLFTQFGFSGGNSNTIVGLDKISFLRGNAMFGGFVPTLIDQQVNGFEDVTDLYFRPDMVNNLFQQMVDFYLHVDPSYDFFKCAIHYEVHKVSTMPKIGLLNLNV